MKRGEVWWVEFDPSIGTKIRKTRPAVIVSNDIANAHLARVVMVPLTSSGSGLYPGEALITLAGKQGKAMADQIMAADKSRLKSRLGAVTAAEMEVLDAAMMLHLGLAR